jgi:hypothetical protein
LDCQSPFLILSFSSEIGEDRIAEKGTQALPKGTKEHSEFLIRHDKVDLSIYLSPSKTLFIHEETIPDRVAELRDSIMCDGVVKDPVVVDAGSCVVLDGMHRVAALKELRCSYVPVCAVDYLNPNIKVGVWYRILCGRFSTSQFETAFSSSGLRFERSSFDAKSVTENAHITTIFASGESLRLKGDGWQVYEVLKTAEQCAQQLGLTVTFETERDALELLVNKKTDAIITIPKIDKATVREAGLTGPLLPHKVTRHVIPARPLGVNVPLRTLTDANMPLEEANRQFIANLQARKITRRPSGSVIGDRRYEEETFIFN